MPTTAEALRYIADDIEAKGHFRGGGKNCPSDSTCPVISVLDALTGYHDEAWEAKMEVFRTILRAANLPVPEEEYHLSDDVIAWNDSTPTDEVLFTLRAAAEAEEGAGR